MLSTVNNAGYVQGVDHVGDIDPENIEGMFATNVFGLIAVTQLLLKGGSLPRLHKARFLTRINVDFKYKKSGHIINLGSIAGVEPYAGGSIYTATKHAVRAFTSSMRRELVNTPIRVTEIQPGTFLHHHCEVLLRSMKGWSKLSSPWSDSEATQMLQRKFTKA